jgi:DNA-directed RNA polymerase specialized sigma24 family protein
VPRFPLRQHRGAADLGDVTDTTPAHRAAERAARQSYGKLVAYSPRAPANVAAAEDALCDAFASALASWPTRGVPQAPEAWLLAAARRRIIDMARRRRTREAVADRLLLSVEEAAEGMDPANVPDWRLRLMFACAHPAIDMAMRGPLMLQTVLGLDAAVIAAAFLTTAGAMNQRLVRAKRRIHDTRIPFGLPDRADPTRLQARLSSGASPDQVFGPKRWHRGLSLRGLIMTPVTTPREPSPNTQSPRGPAPRARAHANPAGRFPEPWAQGRPGWAPRRASSCCP